MSRSHGSLGQAIKSAGIQSGEWAKKEDRMQISRLIMCLFLCAPFLTPAQAEDLGNLSANPFDFNSTANPFGQGSAFAPNGVNNPFSPYGSPFSNQSATNPFATDAPKLYDQQGNYRGKLSGNPYDPDSTSNQFGRYGSPFSPDSLNNPYGAGTRFAMTRRRTPMGGVEDRGESVKVKKDSSGQLRYSPSDLVRYLASPFASWMDRYHLENPGEVSPDEQTDDQKLIAQTGNQHERAVLQEFESSEARSSRSPRQF